MRQRLQARIDMLMENIALRHQLMVYERGRTARRSLSGNDRLLWCFLARFFSTGATRSTSSNLRPSPAGGGCAGGGTCSAGGDAGPGDPASTPSYRL